MDLLASVEAGGSKFICAIGTASGEILTKKRIDTTTPDQTINQCVEFLKNSEYFSNVRALGIASFGPIDLDIDSQTWGFITSTPKKSWINTNLVGQFSNSLGLQKIAFDTDVNGAALAESIWGATKGLTDSLYFTIGTGIGGGAIVNGSTLSGLMHPEMGHILIEQNPDDDFAGVCPYHKNCFEGLASGPAIEKRWGASADVLSDDHPAWDLEAEYISKALHTSICVLSPMRIVLGGGVMKKSFLFDKIYEILPASLNGYIQKDQTTKAVRDYIVPPGLGEDSGILGGIGLAIQAFS